MKPDPNAGREYDITYEDSKLNLLENGTVKTTVVIQGGGGGGGNSSVITIERLDGSALTVIAGDPAVINYRFTSIDNSGDDTGSATGVWYVGNTKVGTQTIIQGKNSFDVTQYLHSGDNTVKLQVTDSVGSVGTKTWTINVVEFYVNAKVAAVEGIKGKFVTDVTYNAGVLSVAKGDEPVTTTMTGIVHEPTYDAETRTIKLPVFGGDTLTIALGKDLVVKSGIYNTETHEIELTITTGEVIKIPVGSLIDIYIGVATSTATVTVSDDNKISVDVRVSAKANNSITIEEDGLYVAVPDAYTKSETDAKIKKVQDQLDGHSKDAVVHITAEERKAWNAKVSQDELTAAKSEVISAAAADATKKADAARDTAKTYADGLNTAMDNRVKNVEGALTWKAIDDSGANAET